MRIFSTDSKSLISEGRAWSLRPEGAIGLSAFDALTLAQGGPRVSTP
jgi:hypothetical protein